MSLMRFGYEHTGSCSTYIVPKNIAKSTLSLTLYGIRDFLPQGLYIRQIKVSWTKKYLPPRVTFFDKKVFHFLTFSLSLSLSFSLSLSHTHTLSLPLSLSPRDVDSAGDRPIKIGRRPWQH